MQQKKFSNKWGEIKLNFRHFNILGDAATNYIKNHNIHFNELSGWNEPTSVTTATTKHAKKVDKPFDDVQLISKKDVHKFEEINENKTPSCENVKCGTYGKRAPPNFVEQSNAVEKAKIRKVLLESDCTSVTEKSASDQQQNLPSYQLDTLDISQFHKRIAFFINTLVEHYRSVTVILLYHLKEQIFVSICIFF